MGLELCSSRSSIKNIIIVIKLFKNFFPRFKKFREVLNTQGFLY